MKRVLKSFRSLGSVLVLVATLLVSLLPQPAKAIDTCSTNVVTQNPTTNFYDVWWGSPHNLYQSQEKYYLSFRNNSNHSCILQFDMNITTSNGWFYEEKSNWSSQSGPMVTMPGATCVWYDSAPHKSFTCTRTVPSGGNVSDIIMNWYHTSPLNGATDTNAYTVSIHDNSDGSDYILASGTTTIH
jgi:hypothetical protein